MKMNRLIALILLILLPAAFVAASGSNDNADEYSRTEAATLAAGETDTPEQPEGMEPPPGGMPGGTPGDVDHGTYAAIVDSDVDGEVYESAGDTENALRVEGDVQVTLENITINKTSGAAADGDASAFYGSNAAFLATDGAEVVLRNAVVTTTAEGGNGIFSYGSGTDVTVENAVIRTTMGNSGGFMVTGGGSMTVVDSDVETQGRSSAALRTDRGGGTLTVEGGRYTANGEGSPAVYSTAEITVSNAVLSATTSEAIVVEGANSVLLEDCTVSGNMVRNNVENLQNVMIYQSMSGDADVGQSSFRMHGGSLVSGSGDMFYVTNTSCSIELEDVDLELSNDWLLRIAGNDARNGWGTVGSNGGNCDFLAIDQELEGDIFVDSISEFSMELSDGTVFTGTINPDGEAGSVTVHLDETSRWILTGDAYLTGLTGSVENIESGGFQVFVDGTAVL